MSLAPLIVWLHVHVLPVPWPPGLHLDLKVREWQTNHVPTSYQLTLSVEIP